MKICDIIVLVAVAILMGIILYSDPVLGWAVFKAIAIASVITTFFVGILYTFENTLG